MREITIATETTTIQDFHLEEGETLSITFTVDPISLSFYSSTLFRIPSGIFSRDSLRSFTAYNSSISGITASDFVNAVNLRFLSLSSNSILSLEDNLFANALLLETINLSNNGIVTVSTAAFAGLSNLQELFLYSNEIVTLSGAVFAPLTSLVYLDLGSNAIVDINLDLSNLEHLRALWLEYNAIETIGNNSIVSPSLLSLYIYGNTIRSLSDYVFDDLPSLTTLSLGSNQMQEISENAFFGLSQLQILSLYDNEISSLPSGIFMPLGMLNSLDLGYNSIEEINFRLFSTNQNLNTLWMEANALKSFDIRKTVSMVNLQSLFLHDNYLTALNLTDVGFILPRLRYLSVGANDFYCNEVVQILANIRRFNIEKYFVYEQDETKVILDGIGCYEYQPRNVQSRTHRAAKDSEAASALKIKVYGESEERGVRMGKRPEVAALPITQ